MQASSDTPRLLPGGRAQETPIPLDAWDRKFEGLARRIGRLSDRGRQALERRLFFERRRKNRLTRRLRSSAHGSRAAWDRVRRELARAQRDFRQLRSEVGRHERSKE